MVITAVTFVEEIPNDERRDKELEELSDWIPSLPLPPPPLLWGEERATVFNDIC
jgi:hypothetical protein